MQALGRSKHNVMLDFTRTSELVKSVSMIIKTENKKQYVQK